MGLILPLTVLRSPTTEKLRNMWATEYHDVIVITMAQAKARGSAFSADTGMAECIVVATKGIDKNTGRGKFVCLNQKPQSGLEAIEIANRINRSNSTRKLEDAPDGGDIISVGSTSIGQMLDSPINRWYRVDCNTREVNGIAADSTQNQRWKTPSSYVKRGCFYSHLPST